MNEINNNLVRYHSYWNPYFAKINNNIYELNNIIIYNESGVLIETGHAWFNESNNKTGDHYIGEIKKINKNNIEKNLKSKNNFIIKDNESSFENRYILYIYYKNINYKFIKISLNYFLEINYTLFGNDSKIYSKAIGQKTKLSQNINYNKIYPLIDEMKYKSVDELKKKIKELNKIIKEYENATIFENSLKVDDEKIKEIYFNGDETQKIINNNKNLLEDQKNG